MTDFTVDVKPFAPLDRAQIRVGPEVDGARTLGHCEGRPRHTAPGAHSRRPERVQGGWAEDRCA
eukprot:1289371-Pyramimonas_sp.AAC.1